MVAGAKGGFGVWCAIERRSGTFLNMSVKMYFSRWDLIRLRVEWGLSKYRASVSCIERLIPISTLLHFFFSLYATYTVLSPVRAADK